MRGNAEEVAGGDVEQRLGRAEELEVPNVEHVRAMFSGVHVQSPAPQRPSWDSWEQAM
jgi:hypothetical protein